MFGTSDTSESKSHRAVVWNAMQCSMQGMRATAGRPTVSFLPVCELVVVEVAGWEVAYVGVHAVLD